MSIKMQIKMAARAWNGQHGCHCMSLQIFNFGQILRGDLCRVV